MCVFRERRRERTKTNSVYLTDQFFIPTLQQETLEAAHEEDIPALSAIFLDPDVGILNYLKETSNVFAKDVQAARAKAFDAITKHIERVGQNQSSSNAREMRDLCMQQFRSEQQNTTKAAALGPIIALFGMQLPFDATEEELKKVGESLRRDYERTAKTPTVKSLILKACAALHANFDVDYKEEDAARDAHPRWLINKALGILDDQIGSADSDDDDDVENEEEVKGASGKEKKKIDMVLISGALEAIASSLQSVPDKISTSSRKALSKILLKALEPPSYGQRSEVPKSAMKVVECVGAILKKEFIEFAPEIFEKLLELRVCSNKDLTRNAMVSLDAFLITLRDALMDNTLFEESKRIETMKSMMGKVKELLETKYDKNSNPRKITVAVRALGKLAKPAFYMSSDELAMDLDELMEQLARFTLEEKFAAGGNAFEKRFESMERQVALLIAYTDVLELQQTVDEATLDMVASILRWIFEHYSTEVDTRKRVVHDAIVNLFQTLYERGGALRSLFSRCGQALVLLTLRVGPPDPIDRLLVDAPPIQLWPRYVDLWVRLLGGDEKYERFKPNRASKRRISSSGSDTKRRSQSIDSAVATEHLSENSMNVHGMDIDVVIDQQTQIAQGAASATYDCFMEHILLICNTLELGVRESTVIKPGASLGDEAQEKEAKIPEDLVDKNIEANALIALNLEGNLEAKNPGDVQTFLGLVDFFRKVIDESPSRHMCAWIGQLGDELMLLATKNTALSGFYKLIQSSLHAAERSGYFRSARLDENVQKITKDYETHQNASNDEEQAARLDVARSFQNFLHEVLAESSGKTGELRAASLSLLLEAPEGLLSLKDLVQPLCSMLELGLQHSPMAETGLRVLETWLTNRREELLPALPECVRSLRPYLDRGDGLSEDSEIDRNEAMAMFDIDENTRSGSIAEWRFEKRMEKQALEQRSNSEEKILLMRILRLLGSLGSYSHFLVNSLEEDERSSTDQNRDSSILWDSTMRISIDLPLYASEATLWLDSCLPRIAQLAKFSRDRATKVAACEALHAMTLLMVGRNARRPDSTDDKSGITPFHLVYRSLFPVILDLAADFEPVTSTLFRKLAFQLTRWFTKNQVREAAETMALLDAITLGVADARFGVKRDLCAALAAEALKWSIKQMADVQNAVNVKSILRRIYSLMSHPDSNRRLGASSAALRCLELFETQDGSATEILKNHILEMLEVTLRSFRLASFTQSKDAAEDATARLSRLVVRVCKRHARLLMQPSKPARSGSFQTLRDIVVWIFDDGVARPERRLRLESQYAFCVLYPTCEFDILGHIDDKGLPFTSDLFDEVKNVNVSNTIIGPSDPAKCDAAISWLNAARSAFHFARWSLEVNILPSEIYSQPRHLGIFQNVSEYLLQFEEDAAINVGPSALRKWRRSKVDFLLQVLLFVHTSITKLRSSSSETKASQNLALKEVVETNGFVKVLVKSFLSLESFETEPQEEARISATSAGVLKELNLLVKEYGDRLPPYLKEMNTKVLEDLRLGVSKDSTGDLGCVNLSSTSGCSKAARLVTGYRKLFEIKLLRGILPQEEMQSGVIGERLVMVVYNLGKSANPRQKAVGTEILRLAFQLGIDAHRIMEIILRRDDELEDGSFFTSAQQNAGMASTQRRKKEKIARLEQEKGELFYLSFHKLITNYVTFDFEKYATSILDRAANDISSPGGRIATLLLISVLTDAGIHARSVLLAFTKHILILDPLVKSDSSRSNDIIARCQRRALAIIERALILDASLKKNRVLFHTEVNHEKEKKEQENAAYFIGDALATCLRLDSSSSARIEATRISMQILLQDGIDRNNVCSAIVIEALTDLVKHVKAVELDPWDSSGVAEGTKDAILRSFRESCSKSHLMRVVLPLIEDKYSDQTLKFMTKAMNSVENAWDEALAVELFILAFEKDRETYQKRVCGRLLSVILMNSSSSAVCTFISERVDAIVEVLERNNRGESNTDADATNVLNAFIIMNGLYQKCSKEQIANVRPKLQNTAEKQKNLNQIVSTRALVEIKGKGASGKTIFEVDKELCLRIRQVCFETFSALLNRTQTKEKIVKFFDTLLQGDAQRFNGLIDGNSPCYMEPIWSKYETPGVLQDASKAEGENALPFTMLSSTLLNLDPTLTTKTIAEPTELAKNNVSHPRMDACYPQESAESLSHSIRDNLEAFSVSNGFYFLLDIAMQGAPEDLSLSGSTLIGRIVMLLKDVQLLPHIRFAIAKAVLRAQRVSIQAFNPAKNAKNNESNTEMSLFRTIAPDLLSAVVIALIDVSKYCNESTEGSKTHFQRENIIPSPCREIIVMALECTETWTVDTRCALSNLLCFVIRNSPTGSVVELRENVALGTRLARKLRDCILSNFDSNTVYNTFYDALKELQTLVKTPSQEETGRLRRIAGVQMIGAFVADGILDITGKKTVVKFSSETQSHENDWRSDITLTRAVVHHCLMKPDATSGRKCHEAAASLVGFALAKRAEKRMALETSEEEEEAWVRDLSARLHTLKQHKLDLFLIALDRISKHYPPYPYETDFASIVQSSLDKIYGEPRYVALCALSHDIISSENNIECAKQLLPRMKSFLDNRDPQTHALLMEILARGVLFASSEATNASEDTCDAELLNSESKRLWLVVMNKIDRVFQSSSPVATRVRAAQAKLCAAVLHAFPDFRKEGVVMGPLFRAMADPNEGAGRAAAREHWEKVNHVYTLGERLLDLMKTPPSASAEDSWIKATCALVLAIPETHQDYEQTVAEDDLADCELTELNINTDWQGSSLPMTPLFSTMGTQMTLTSSSGLPGSGRRFVPGNVVGVPHKPAPGLIRATPAALGTLAIATQQAQAATLVSDVTKVRSGGSRIMFSSSTLGMEESGDLPEWLIGEQAQSGTLQRDPLFGSTLPPVPQTQVTHHQKQTTIDGSSKWPAKRTISQDYYKRKDETATSLEARKYRALQKHSREQRKHAVHLVRRYRDGELPDVKISRAEILAPLVSLAKRDHAISVLLLSALWNAAQSEKSRLTIKETNEPWKNAVPGGSQREQARNLLYAFAKSIKGSNVFLASWVLRASAADKESRVSPKDLRRIAFAGDCLAGGIIALESTLMGKKSTALTEDSSDNSTNFTWRAMAALHRATGDGDAALLSVAKAFDDDEQTHSALKAQLAGDAKKAGKIYKKMKQNNTNTETVEWRFWTRERTRCAERLGEWSSAFNEFDENVKRCVKAGEWRQTSNLLTVSGEELRGVSGEASGGDMSAAAIRIGLREPTLNMGGFLDFLYKSGTDKADEDYTRHALLLQDLGVEFAVRAFVNELEDTSKTIIRDVRDRFATRWSSTHPKAVAVRRALLQSLQPCVEIEEVLHCATLSRIPISKNEMAEFEKGLKSTLSKWQMRWPSTSYDSVEVWERVSSFRSICLEALSHLAKQTSKNSIKQANIDACWHASRGLRRVGETKLSLKFLQKYGEAIKNSDKEKEWKYAKAKLKGKLSVTNDAEDLESILSTIRNREDLEKSFVIAPHMADVKNIEGSICEKLCMFTKDKNRVENLARETISCYSAAESCAEAENNVKLSSKASLNLARFCDELLIRFEDSMTMDFDTLSATLVKHVLRAMKTRSKACEKARHLLPRVLALLRATTGKSPILLEFVSGVRNTAAWYFLDWISELVVLLSSESSYDAVSPLMTRLVDAYPAAMRPHFSLGKNNLTLAALKIGEVLLNSQAALQFERAITLLDFPMARLKWWWKEIELVEHKEGLPPDSKKLSMLLNEMLEDVANPDEANLGPINATFGKLAKPILVEITRSRSINPNTSAISKLLQDAVFEIEKRWRKCGNEVFESASTLPLGRFSLFFSSFEQRSYGNVKEQFMANLEIPGQYDSLSQAPDPTWHAKIVSFETNATIFTQSKQKPKKITLRGSDGREYAFIAKGSEDLRQDERIQRLYRAMDSLLTQSPSARAKALRIRTFHVLPLTRRSGLIEFVHGTEPVGRILLNSSDDAKKNIGNVSARHEAFIKARGMFGLSGKKRKEIDGDALIQEDKMGVMCDLTKVPRPAHDDYLTAMANAELNASKKVLRGLGHPGHSPAKDAIRQKLQVASGCPEAFLAARRVFAASLAASSISGWIVGLGDRHCENILLDVAHGSLIHVDFGYAFGTGTSTLPIPEIVPFRATRTFLGALEPLDAKEWLEADMARVLTALQSGKNLLEGAMDIFIRDPILDWTRETQKGDDVEKHVEMRVMHARSKLSLANPAFICIEQCKPKHGQSAHWEGLQRLIIGDDDGVRAQAGETCKDVDEQVECLMDMATDPRILANSWTGWKSWL